MLGSSIGMIANLVFPETTAPTGAYALIGMAAFLGGVTHAPIMAVLLLIEMTNNYQIVIPLILATAVSALVSRVINHQSIYTFPRLLKNKSGEFTQKGKS